MTCQQHGSGSMRRHAADAGADLGRTVPACNSECKFLTIDGLVYLWKGKPLSREKARGVKGDRGWGQDWN